MTGRSHAGPPSAILGGAVALGVVIRLVFLVLAGELELWADEAHYVQLAAVWSRFGFYMGSPGYLWPPLYPAFLALFFGLFGVHGIAAAKLGQVLLSGVVGATVVLLAVRLFSRRAGLVAGLLWAGHLPLVAYTHLLWPETVFLSLLLPAILLFVTILEPETKRIPLRLVVVGLLLGLAVLTKEAALPLPALLAAVLLLSSGQGQPARRLVRAAIMVLATAAVVLPWSLRCREVYGRWIASGATVGQNLFWGVNSRYVNHDYTSAGHSRARSHTSVLHRSLISLPSTPAWLRAEVPNVIDRSRQDAGRALDFVAAHPGFYVASRVKRLADWATPLSFFDRHYRLNRYHGWMNAGGVRQALVGLSLVSTVLLLLAALPGFFWTLLPRYRWLLGAVLLAFLAPVLVVSMSRYRVPAEPLLLVLAAGVLTVRRRPPLWSARGGAVWAGWVLLVALWALNLGEVGAELARIF